MTPAISAHWQSGLQCSLKRSLDVGLSFLLLVASSPILVLIALGVKVDSPGQILYRWRVVGKYGQPFTSWKIRSMRSDADDMKAELLDRNEMRGPVFKLTNDPRITPLGRWIRRYSLDELPQLWSVLKGDMSLVGPRPPLVSEYARFTEFQKQKLAVKPGITCLWQIHGRNRVNDFDEWVRMDLEYIRRWSLWLDLKILLKTAREVFTGSGK